jgi:hypothetical protein
MNKVSAGIDKEIESNATRRADLAEVSKKMGELHKEAEVSKKMGELHKETGTVLEIVRKMCKANTKEEVELRNLRNFMTACGAREKEITRRLEN